MTASQTTLDAATADFREWLTAASDHRFADAEAPRQRLVDLGIEALYQPGRSAEARALVDLDRQPDRGDTMRLTTMTPADLSRASGHTPFAIRRAMLAGKIARIGRDIPPRLIVLSSESQSHTAENLPQPTEDCGDPTTGTRAPDGRVFGAGLCTYSGANPGMPKDLVGLGLTARGPERAHSHRGPGAGTLDSLPQKRENLPLGERKVLVDAAGCEEIGLHPESASGRLLLIRGQKDATQNMIPNKLPGGNSAGRVPLRDHTPLIGLLRGQS